MLLGTGFFSKIITGDVIYIFSALTVWDFKGGDIHQTNNYKETTNTEKINVFCILQRYRSSPSHKARRKEDRYS